MSADENIATQVIPDATIPEPVVDAPKADSPAPSLRDTIKASIKASEAPVEGETQEQKDQRVRDEAGRFAKGKEPKTGTLTLKDPNAEAQPNAAKEGTPLVVNSPTVAAIKAPDGWKESAKAKFAALDPEVQTEILRRERESHQKITSQDEDRTFGKQIKEIARPYEAIMRAEGADVATSFKALMNMAYVIRTGTPEQKKQILLTTARQYNVDLGIPLQQGPVDPQIAALQREVSELRQARQAEIQQRQTQESTVIQSALDDFLAEPGIEHFEQLKPAMAALLQSGAAQTYREAYDKAAWADPDIRSTLLASQQREAEDKRVAEAKAKADAAKRAAVSVTGGPGGVRPSTANGAGDRPLRDELRANLRAAQGRI